MAKNSRINLLAINALAEFERIGLDYQPAGDEEIKFCCPVHADKSPSASLNTKTNLWKCQAAGCEAKGDLVSLLCHVLKVERKTILVDLDSRYDLKILKTVNPAVIEKYHKAIWDSGPLLQELYARGVTDNMIRRARLGFNRGRITVPIYDNQHRVINVRMYLPGAPGPEKMKNIRGYSSKNLFQVEQLKYDVIWILGGEIKALVAGGMLNEVNVGCVSGTIGEGNWHPSFSELLKDKIVFVCYDVDKGGRKGAQFVAGFIYDYAKTVSIIDLPLDKTKYPKGDINDFVGLEKGTTEQLVELMKTAHKYTPPQMEDEKEDTSILPIDLSDATNEKFIGKRIEVKAVVTSMDTTPYLCPEIVVAKCTRDQAYCSWCPVKSKVPDEITDEVEMQIKRWNPSILELVNCPNSRQPSVIQEALRIPTCKAVKFEIKSHFNVMDTRISPELLVGNECSKNVVQPALVVGHGIDMNTPYVFTGKTYPSPKSQQALLLMNEIKECDDNLDAFKLGNGQYESLKIFQPKEWTTESLTEKLEHVYTDLEANVTRIFYRRDLHLVMDLSFHSVLLFNFDGQEIKGWTNSLIVGDSSQGKSETGIRLQEHYGLGERVECKNATVAGLLGGLHQVGTRWFVSWGVIPTHDRRLVILEEIKGTDPEVIAKLTDMRSSGIAEIPKIEKRRAFARTRLIFISNPRSNRTVSSYNFGIEIIKELMQGLEDIRRLDLALIVSSSQVDPALINRSSSKRLKVKHYYLNNLCQKLILWAWTLKTNQILISSDVTEFIIEKSIYLSSKYTEILPLIDRGTIRHKIARLAVALAARTFSVDENKNLVVRECHVDYICNFLDRIYSDPIFGYAEFSEAQVAANIVKDKSVVIQQLRGVKHPQEFVEQLLFSETICLTDICDWCDVDREEAQKLLSFLVRKRTVRRLRREYVKTSEFIVMLKELKSRGIPKKAETSEEDEF